MTEYSNKDKETFFRANLFGTPISIEDLYQIFKERLRAEENDLIPSDEFVDKGGGRNAR